MITPSHHPLQQVTSWVHFFQLHSPASLCSHCPTPPNLDVGGAHVALFLPRLYLIPHQWKKLRLTLSQPPTKPPKSPEICQSDDASFTRPLRYRSTRRSTGQGTGPSCHGGAMTSGGGRRSWRRSGEQSWRQAGEGMDGMDGWVVWASRWPSLFFGVLLA